jgi:hypothetical protein
MKAAAKAAPYYIFRVVTEKEIGQFGESPTGLVLEASLRRPRISLDARVSLRASWHETISRQADRWLTETSAPDREHLGSAKSCHEWAQAFAEGRFIDRR